VSSHHELEPALEPTSVTRPRRPTVHAERIALVDLLDRVLAGGVVVSGEVTLSIADVDMVRVSLRALVTSVSALAKASADQEVPGR
jgi:gas vesicle protein GvpA/GvpJ/GvpM family